MTSTVYIAKNVYGGDGLGRLGDGRVVFVPGAFTGENVKAEIVEEKKHFVKARLVEIVEGAAERIGNGPSPVPGMVYSNLSFTGECEAKAAQLAEFFERARIALPSPIASVPAGPLTEGNYRNKVVYHFARQQGKWVIGYRQEPSHEIVDVTSDPLAVPEINAKLPEIRSAVLALLTQGPLQIRKETERKANVTIRWTKKSGVKWWVGDAPAGGVLRETTLGRDFEVPYDGFYQVNPSVGEALVQAVVDRFAKTRADIPNVLDLYCGVGVFGLCCDAEKTVGVESGRQAIDFARRNAAMRKRTNCEFIAEQVGRCLRRLQVDDRTAVIVDPPRGGMEPNVVKFLAQGLAPRIFYVSCDPATMMRDLSALKSRYAVEEVLWFNMFARTARFETLVSLVRR